MVLNACESERGQARVNVCRARMNANDEEQTCTNTSVRMNKMTRTKHARLGMVNTYEIEQMGTGQVSR